MSRSTVVMIFKGWRYAICWLCSVGIRFHQKCNTLCGIRSRQLILVCSNYLNWSFYAVLCYTHHLLRSAAVLYKHLKIFSGSRKSYIFQFVFILKISETLFLKGHAFQSPTLSLEAKVLISRLKFDLWKASAISCITT